MILDSQALFPTIPMPRCPFWNVYCVIVSSLTIWQWTKKWWRGFLGAAASIWAVRLFQVKWKDDSDDFGRDLMRGTIGEQVVTELWPLWSFCSVKLVHGFYSQTWAPAKKHILISPYVEEDYIYLYISYIAMDNFVRILFSYIVYSHFTTVHCSVFCYCVEIVAFGGIEPLTFFSHCLSTLCLIWWRWWWWWWWKSRCQR